MRSWQKNWRPWSRINAAIQFNCVVADNRVRERPLYSWSAAFQQELPQRILTHEFVDFRESEIDGEHYRDAQSYGEEPIQIQRRHCSVQAEQNRRCMLLRLDDPLQEP